MVAIDSLVRWRTVGQVLRWAFVAFNVLMVSWTVDAVAGLGERVPAGGYVEAGAAFGATVGLAFTLFAWAIGGSVLGAALMLTRSQRDERAERPMTYRSADDNWVPEPRLRPVRLVAAPGGAKAAARASRAPTARQAA